jgi:hypothetical protein
LVTAGNNCGECLCRPVAHHAGLTAQECTAISELSGFRGETWEGHPIVAAALIPRREFARFGGMRRWAWCDTEWPMFARPWSRWAPGRRPILMHGPAYRAASGEAHRFECAGDGSFVLEHRCSHCPACPTGSYWLRYLALDLPRRLLENGRLSPVVTTALDSVVCR